MNGGSGEGGIVLKYNTLAETKEQRSGMEREKISGKGWQFQIQRGKEKSWRRGVEGGLPTHRVKVGLLKLKV